MKCYMRRRRAAAKLAKPATPALDVADLRVGLSVESPPYTRAGEFKPLVVTHVDLDAKTVTIEAAPQPPVSEVEQAAVSAAVQGCVDREAGAAS